MASSTQLGLEQELRDAGNRLLSPPSSTDELLNLLDEVEMVLSKVEQAPPLSIQDALLPTMKALIANDILRHSDINVKVSVASCFTELTRITAPDAPYNDELMKEIFQLTVTALEKLSDESGRCYDKALSVLDTVAKVHSCLLMLDLECDELIVEMFQLFFRTIRFSHPDAVFMDMNMIMTLVVDESEEISMELLRPLLFSLKKETQSVSPLSWKLGEKVMKKCATKLQPYLREAVQSASIDLNDYADVVASIFQDASEGKTVGAQVLNQVEELSKSVGNNCSGAMKSGDAVDNSNPSKPLEWRCQITDEGTASVAAAEANTLDSVKAVKPIVEAEEVTKRRGRKPNSLIKPEEGYDNSWISGKRKSTEQTHRKKNLGKKIVGSTSNVQAPDDASLPELEIEARLPDDMLGTNNERVNGSPSHDPSFIEGSRSEMGRPKKKRKIMRKDGDLDVRNTQSKEKSSHPIDTISSKKLKRDSKKILETDSSKDASAVRNDEQRTPLVVVKNEDGISSGSERKQVSSAQQKDGRKRSRGRIVSEKHISENLSKKKKISLSQTKSLTKNGSDVDELSGTKSKVQRTPKKKEDTVPPLVKDYGEELVGCMIKVWWPMDQTFYEGAVHSFDPLKKKHKVLYADGDEEILNLNKERWELVPKKEPETYNPSPPASSDMLRKKKAKGTSEIGMLKTADKSNSENSQSVKDLKGEEDDQPHPGERAKQKPHEASGGARKRKLKNLVDTQDTETKRGKKRLKLAKV